MFLPRGAVIAEASSSAFSSSFRRLGVHDLVREFRLSLLLEHFRGAGADGGIDGQTCDAVGAEERVAFLMGFFCHRDMHKRMLGIDRAGKAKILNSTQKFRCTSQ